MGNTTKTFVEQHVLLDGEKILWEGRPKSIKFFESPHTTLMIIRWAIAALLFFAAIKYLNYASTLTLTNNVKYGTCIFLIGCGVLVGIRPFLNIRNLEKRINYIITDKRVIAYRKKDSEMAYILSRDLKDFTEATITTKEGNLGDLYIGPKTGSIVRKGRQDLPPVVRPDEYMTPMVLYNIFLPEEAAMVLPPHMTVNNLHVQSEKKAA